MARMPNRADLEAAVDAAINLGKAQAKALAALPGAINAVAEAANNINATANEARAVIRKAQAVTDRLDSMLDHVEPAVSEITPTLQALKEAQQRIVAMTGSTEKLASFVDDAGAGLSRLAGMSGASGLFNRIAAATKPEPASRPLSSVRTEPAAEILPPETPPEEVLAELVGADQSPVELDDPEIHDAELADDVAVPYEGALPDADLADDVAVPYEEALPDADLADDVAVPYEGVVPDPEPADDLPGEADAVAGAMAGGEPAADTDLAHAGSAQAEPAGSDATDHPLVDEEPTDSDWADAERADAQLSEADREGPAIVEDPPAAYDYFGHSRGAGAAESSSPAADDVRHPVELGSEADGPDVEDEPIAG